ncbi:MAG: outer membrane protein assembly factor [Fibrobacterales bacterium]
MKNQWCIGVILGLISMGWSQTTNDTTRVTIEVNLQESEEDSVLEKSEEEFQKWALLPIIVSSTETSWRLGVFAAHFFKPEQPNDNASSVETAAFYTLKNQMEVSAKPDMYWGTYHMQTYFFYSIWPANYYGIGMSGKEDSTAFDATNYGVQFLLEKEFFPGLYAGVTMEFTEEDITPKESGSILDNPTTVGGHGARTNGFGFIMTYDNKNHQYWATEGEYVKLETFGYHKNFGSEFNFFKYRFKASKYFPVGSSGAIATMVHNHVNYGDAIPFRSLATPDGVYEMRGVESGRYRDNNLISVGAEYRRELWWRLGMVTFAEAFQVWGQESDFKMGETLYSIGLGGRVALNPQNKFNVRADISYVQKSGLSLTVYIREAF